jgi:heme a synthase
VTPSIPLAPESGDADASRRARFARFAWANLWYTVAVVLFGAVVRITGSGAGCGQHWPTCQGEVVHFPKTVATAIELSHRVTSGLSGGFVVAVALGALWLFPRGHATRRFALAAVVLMMAEALIGRELVKHGLVANDTSTARVVVMAAHLVNTSLLTGVMALAAHLSDHPEPRHWLPACRLDWALAACLVVALVVSVTGAVTALGDTLYPVATHHGVVARLTADQTATANPLERLRALHPLVAFGSAVSFLVVAWQTSQIRPRGEVVRGARVVVALVFCQVSAGVVNILLSAPGFMQVIHLALATALWLALVLFYPTAMAARRTT